MVVFPEHFASWTEICRHQELLEVQNLRPTSDGLRRKRSFTRSPAGLDAVLLGGSVRSTVGFLPELRPSVSDLGPRRRACSWRRSSTSPPWLSGFLQFLVLGKALHLLKVIGESSMAQLHDFCGSQSKLSFLTGFGWISLGVEFPVELSCRVFIPAFQLPDTATHSWLPREPFHRLLDHYTDVSSVGFCFCFSTFLSVPLFVSVNEGRWNLVAFEKPFP